jgi:ribonucleoside-diphosphate reductase alpha chain
MTTVKIKRIQLEEPIEVFDLTIDETHSFFANGILAHNCVEIIQNNELSTYNEDLTYDKVGRDISCNLGSNNVDDLMNSPNFENSIETAIRALTNVSIDSNITCVPSIQNGNQLTHAIGLGQMNLHGFFGKHKMFYGSEESLDFTNMYFYTIAYYALKASNKIAIEKNSKFFGFEDSKYASGEYFEKYISEEWKPKFEKVEKLFSKIHIPTINDWLELKESVMKYGIFNKYLQAIPPTGSISYINNATASIHPVPAPIEVRKEGKVGRVYYPAPGLTNDNIEYYQDAYEIGYEKLIDIYAEATKHVDQGLSMTLFLPASYTTRDINKAQIYAFKKGIKTIYYIRLKAESLEGTKTSECVSCTL